MKKTLLFKFIAFSLFALLSAGVVNAQVPNAWINEIHYDNTGTDANEAIEIVVENPESWDLALLRVDLYNGNNGTTYYNATVDTYTSGDISMTYTIYSNLISSSIQNGAPDGMALSYNGTLIQFLSYEGTLAAIDGPAIGITSTDIGVLEDGTGPVGESLQLSGTGSDYASFTWQVPAAATFGSVNTDQVLGSGAFTATDLFFSEYIEGSSSNKALEIFNGTGADVDLSGYFVKIGNNGGDWGADGSSASLPLSGILADGDVYVIANAESITGILDQADSTFLYSSTLEGHTVTAFNGDDALGLFKGAVLIDMIGTQGFDPGTGWPVAGVFNATLDNTLVRKASVTAGAIDWAISAGTTVDDSQWIVNDRDMIDNLGIHTFGESADVTPPSFTATPTNGDINVAINSTIVLTFDESIRNIDDSEITDANVVSLLTLKETDASGADVPFTATIDVDKKIITATPTSAFANSMVYYAAIDPVEDAADNATVMSSMTFTTIGANTPVLSDVNVVPAGPYFAGDTVAITWVSANVTDVKIEVWFALQNFWVEVFPSTPSDGLEGFIIPSFSPYSADYKVRITNLADTTVSAESSTFTVIAVANDLATLRAQPVNSMVKYTGVATVTYARTSRNQKYIQDATAAVLIDDPTTAPGFITGTYNIGDGITNIVGKIVLYGQLVELTPVSATGEPATGTEIIPEVRTLASLTSADQCKLVKIEDFAFLTPTQYDVDGKFVASKSYDLNGFDNTAMVYRTTFAESDYIGGMVPVVPFSSVVLVGQYNAQMQITARSWSDMTLPFELPKLVITEIMYNSPDAAGDEEWIELYNNGTSAVDVSGYYILDSDTAHIADPMVIPAGNVIAPGEYFTIETSTSGAFPFVPNCDVLDGGSGKFNFGNTSDQVKLYTADGQLVDSVQYADKAPWPTEADGDGASLTLCDPSSDNSLVENWTASLDIFLTTQGDTIYATPGSSCILHTAVTSRLQNGLTVYPNPTSDKLYIANPANELLEITVMSSLGRAVTSVKSNRGVASVDLSKMPKGMYIVKLVNKTNNTTQMKKVVVN